MVRVKEEEEVKKLIEDVLLLEELGCFVIVLEKIFVEFMKEVFFCFIIFMIGIGGG